MPCSTCTVYGGGADILEKERNFTSPCSQHWHMRTRFSVQAQGLLGPESTRGCPYAGVAADRGLDLAVYNEELDISKE